MEFTSKDELRDKIDWEGGIVEAMDYGIAGKHIRKVAGPDIAKKWDQVGDLIDEIEEWLDEE
ncbi:MAG: hypothetical protein ACXABY_34030 [Candidatus Thorarchaeota archaeon]|jgi:hypothetical protein